MNPLGISRIHFALHLIDLKTGDNIDWSTISTAIKINVYRIIQEALQNIDKYAAANKVAISMYKQDATLIITISDDGIGFNTKNSKNGIGLQNMQKRAEECNGTFHIISTSKTGTKIASNPINGFKYENSVWSRTSEISLSLICT